MKHTLTRQNTLLSLSMEFSRPFSSSNNNNEPLFPLKQHFDHERKQTATSPTGPPPTFSHLFSSPPSSSSSFSTSSSVLTVADQVSPRLNPGQNLLRQSGGFVPKNFGGPSSNAQVVVKVTYNKTVYGSREKRTNYMNMLYEKLANKIREDFVLTTADTQSIIERNSTATFDEFLRDSSVSEIQLNAVPFDHVLRVRVTYENTQWETLTLNITPLNTFRELVAQHYQLNSTEFSLISSLSSSHEPMPHRDDLSLGSWSATLISSSSSSGSHNLLLLELSMDVAVRVEQKSNVLFLSEKAQSTIQVLYAKVAEWQHKPISTFYLSNNGILLGRQATATISSLPISTTSMVHIQVLNADAIVKIFIVHPDHRTVLFGYPPEATINEIWPDLASSFPDEVIFPYGSNLVESDMREMFAKNWQKAGFANSVLVLEVLLESETVEVFVEIDDVTYPMLSRFGTLVGDIFNHFIPTDELNGFQFVGHNDAEIRPHEGEWTNTIYDYVEKLKTTTLDIDRITLRAKKKAAYQVVVAGEVCSFPYDDPATLTSEAIVENVRTRFQLPAVTHYVCNAEGVFLLGSALPEAAKSRNYLRLATKNELRNITVNTTRLTIMHNTNAESLTAHLHNVRVLDAEADALCTRERVMLDFAHALPPDMESFVVVPKAKLLSKTIEYDEKSVVISAGYQVELSLVLKYVRFLFSIPADANVELCEKETGFALALELSFDSAEGDIVVQHV